jgi:subtilisin family serine protease
VENPDKTYDSATYNNTGAFEHVKIALLDVGLKNVDSYNFTYDKININPHLDNYNQQDQQSHTHRTNNYVYHGSKIMNVIAKEWPDDIRLKILDIPVFDDFGNGDLFNGICAVYCAIENEADVVNISWGYFNRTVNLFLYKALKEAREKDILIVTSAGNDSTNIDNCCRFPAHFSSYNRRLGNVISVAATDVSQNRLASYSNYGKKDVSVAALGTHIVNINNQDVRIDGTSFSAPVVTRVVAIIRAKKPSWSYDIVRDNILNEVINVEMKVKTGGVVR